jgi:hypothetical protein
MKEELAAIDAEIERLENRRRELYQLSTQAPSHEKLCEDNLARLIAEPDLFKALAFPIEVTGVQFTGKYGLENGYPKRKLVRIRPCAEEFSGKTFLGLYLGDLARTMGVSFNPETGVLEVFLSHHNPAIWVPSLERIIYGFESWWGPIESEEQLRAITTRPSTACGTCRRGRR